jgi:Ulp1 family protease
MEEESLDKKNEAFDFSGWDVLCHEDCPQQRNYSDCGVRACCAHSRSQFVAAHRHACT